MRVLVAYASRFGSTREIAARIADVVRNDAANVDLREMDERLSVDAYDAVVLGSGVYNGSWTDEATTFVRRQAQSLARKHVWLFSVESFGDRHPPIGSFIKQQPKEIGEFRGTTASPPASSISTDGRYGGACFYVSLAGGPATIGAGRT